ncbi:MAG: nucleotidyltransferase domain-containing protein, partial [Syntrophorhabdaceae bacterium]
LLWKACKTCEALHVRTLGRRYLRLDRNVDGFARLSPSILREFLTYSVVGLNGDPAALDVKCAEITSRTHKISRYKLDLARQMISGIMADYTEMPLGLEICFIVAGDIIYNMGHDVPRPERSTGRLVKGSDIDLVVVVDNDTPEIVIKALDEFIYQRKYRMLINPAVNEEVDYKIKKLSLIREQAQFEDFKHMVAIKILQEGILISGSQNLFSTVKKIIRDRGISEKLDALEMRANIFRQQVEEAILKGTLDKAQIDNMHLFYSAEEFEEFE